MIAALVILAALALGIYLGMAIDWALKVSASPWIILPRGFRWIRWVIGDE